MKGTFGSVKNCEIVVLGACVVVEVTVRELNAIWNTKTIVCELCYVSSKLIEACTLVTAFVVPFQAHHIAINVNVIMTYIALINMMDTFIQHDLLNLEILSLNISF